MNPKFRWGVLSTGRIAVVFAKAVGESRTGTVVAVASRDRRKAEEFAAGFDIFLTKPAELHHLVHALAALIGER